MSLRPVSIVGVGQVPVRKAHTAGLRQLAASAVQAAMEDGSAAEVDALFAGNMLADELQGQKHLATLIASEAGLRGVEALQVRAATATGAAALRMAYLAVASGEAERAIAVGVEKMSDGPVEEVLAKALDAEVEVPAGHTLLTQNAQLLAWYMERYGLDISVFDNFALNAHRNSRLNPYALFKDKDVTPEMVRESRIVAPPLRLFDCSPVCDGAAAVLLVPRSEARGYTDRPVHILASSVATDWMRVADRTDPLELYAARRSAQRVFRQANLRPEDVDFFEVHDAFSIIACLLLEAVGYARPGEGWRLAVEGEIFREGRIPIAVMGGLKARGHPIGATALYQACEIALQLSGRAGAAQLPKAEIALLQSVGGVGATVLAYLFGGG